MIDCNNLIHPFQHDPGTSQRQRVMDDLLSGAAKVDGRSMADLLDYFVQLSRHVNYYDADLNVSDWQPFFSKSIPFKLAAIIRYNRDGVNEKVGNYSRLFNKKPSKNGLQLLFHYFFHQVISPVNDWHLSLKGSGLPAELVIEKLIKDKLRAPLEKFICQNNAAVKWHCIKPLNFQRLAANDAWKINLDAISEKADDCKPKGKTKRKRLVNFYQQLTDLLPSFLDAIRIIADTAALSMEQSLFPLKEELQKKHSPHLALLFAFLKLFQHLQGDLNSFTKKHLDYFYQQVLKLRSKDAVPDKVHIVVEIQKQLDKYLLKKGLKLKDGKDNNKAEILFATDDEIVVNKAQVADKRTLFLNNRDIVDQTYLEGVYMAAVADKADGIKEAFPDGGPKSFPTVGSKLSKYTAPGKTLLKPYSNARLGFILASPVLLMNEGSRTIDITMACRLSEDYCNEMNIATAATSNNCCDETRPGIATVEGSKYPDFIDAGIFFNDVSDALNENYFYVSVDLVDEAVKKGISKELENKLRGLLIETIEKSDTSQVCFCPVEIPHYDIVKKESGVKGWAAFRNRLTDPEKVKLDELFKPRKPLQVLFSGEKEWIAPKTPYTISMTKVGAGPEFLLKIKAAIDPDQPAVTFYNKDNLKEDFNTTRPVVKIELDDKIKLSYSTTHLRDLMGGAGSNDQCCLLRSSPGEQRDVSLYHFFRNVSVLQKISTETTRIDVSVCGLKKFIVQNEESVQDVNGPIYPFGSRPDIVEFSVVNPIACITQQFITDAGGLTNKARNFLQSLLTAQNQHRKAIAKNELEAFLDQKDGANTAIFNNNDKAIIRGLVNNPAKKYCQENQQGPEFYIGSQEVFGKNWNAVRINLNWKDKPLNFRDYYSAYVVEDVAQQIFGLDENNFKISVAALKDGQWNPGTADRKLFDQTPPPPLLPCSSDFTQGILVMRNDIFSDAQPFTLTAEKDKPLTAVARNGFMKIGLREQDFLHKDYGFVLARQMMALGRYPDAILEGAVYRKEGSTVLVFRGLAKTLINLKDEIINTRNAAEQAKNKTEDLNTTFDAAIDFPPPLSTINNTERNSLIPLVHDSKDLAATAFQLADDTQGKLSDLFAIIDIFDAHSFEIVKPLTVLIPNEPWTPVIKNISIDYTATAFVTDIDLIHLYPYQGTYKKEDINLTPTLFPVFCDEGNLYIGLKDLVPGSNVNMLFQLAEATSDAESDREEPVWYYLENNQWRILREGFEVLDDDTDGLTTSGIIKFALPANMTKENTILPKDLHWIRASVVRNSRTVSETIGIYTQAVKATFTNEKANDKSRLSSPLTAGAIAKLNEADANIKKLEQPFDSFGGRLPEADGHFYVRVSELLRHKGRAIQKFDYERLALEAFPQLYKVKCINHSYALNAYKYKNDFPAAPGYVILAVIPDMNRLKAAESFEPRVPVSILDDIQENMKKLTSPFVRFRAMNPRYEKINFCLSVKLNKGRDENYYKEKLKTDLREFLAPWAVGQYEKLTFGQCVSRSEIIGFLESRDYIDYIVQLMMWHEDDIKPVTATDSELAKPICPKTPRSILIGGSMDVCIASADCEKWQECGDRQGIECCDNKKIPIADYCIGDIG